MAPTIRSTAKVALFAFLVLASTTTTTEARLRKVDDNVVVAAEENNNGRGKTRKLAPATEAIEIQIVSEPQEQEEKVVQVEVVTTTTAAAAKIAEAEAEAAAASHAHAEAAKFYEERMFQTQQDAINAQNEQERAHEMAMQASTQAEKEAAEQADNMANMVLMDAAQQETEMIENELKESMEYAQHAHVAARKLKELEIRKDGKVVFNGKTYDASQVQFGDEQDEDNDEGAIMEDRPDDIDVELIRVKGSM